MTKKIFHSILLVAGAVLLASLLVILGCLYEYFGSIEKKQLGDELELAAVARLMEMRSTLPSGSLRAQYIVFCKRVEE